MSDVYERLLVPALFRPFALDLARRVEALGPGAVLELAAGTGALTRELTSRPDVVVVATDLNPGMVEVGSALAPMATWETADASSLPFEAGRFDVVACQFGVMFFPDKPQAAREAGRVLRPGGRVLLSTWGALDEHGFASALVAALDEALPDGAPGFVAAVPHGYHDLDVVVADLTAGGLEVLEVDTVTLEGTATADDLAVGFCTGTPLRPAIEQRAELAATVDAVAAAMRARLGEGRVSVPMTAHVVTATNR
ncbi:MAG: SAM-dependent methyltransferase [Actinomycetia bacterium]|nr:SAM-dependent methyltransferase [Actinomycetes bacterium]